MIIGVGFYSHIISNLTTLLHDIDEYSHLFQKINSQFEDICSIYDIPFSI